MITYTIFLRLIFWLTLMILTINSGKILASVPDQSSDTSKPQPPIINDGGSRFSQFDYHQLINNLTHN